MFSALFSLKTLFLIIGVVLILTGFYLLVKIYPSRNYSYMSEKEQGKRSNKAGFAAILFIFGFLFIFITNSSQEINLNTFLSILWAGLCLAPLPVGLTVIRVQKDLSTYTKTKSDVVFLGKDDQD
jgi:hypothetical protein